MKLWTMPRIAVDAFTPNEYLCSCRLATPYSNTFYFDYHNIPKYDADEKVRSHQTNGSYRLDESSVVVGLYSSVGAYYRYTGRYGNYTYSEDDLLGIYEVYVFHYSGYAYAYFYEPGHGPAGHTPTRTKAFS